MLPGLRHNAFIRRNNKEHDVIAADTRQHVLDETFVAGYNAGPSSTGQIEPGESQIDGDAPLDLFLQAVCSMPVSALMSVVLP